MNPRKILIPVVALAAIAAILRVTVFAGGDADGTLAASGTVEATEAQLGFQTPGRLEAVLVREGDRVHAGQELARLDRADLDARRAQATAQLAGARALLAELERGSRSEDVATVREGLRAAEERLTDARRDADRVQRLVEGGALSQEALDRARLQLQVTMSQRDQAAQQLQLVEAGPRPERITAQRAMVAQAEAAVQQVDVALANAVITAPFEGIVTVRGREPGETVGAGAPVLTVQNVADRWVRIYIREDRIGAVRLGGAATITSDTWPDSSYTGTVAYIASEAEFTPRNVQTTEERVKLVYAVKVRITGDAGFNLKVGMPADVVLEAAATP